MEGGKSLRVFSWEKAEESQQIPLTSNHKGGPTRDQRRERRIKAKENPKRLEVRFEMLDEKDGENWPKKAK